MSKTKFIWAIDPSKLGKVTSGTGMCVVYINEESKKGYMYTYLVKGKDYSTQAEYNEAVIKRIENWVKLPEYIRIEEYQDYNKSSTKFQVNGTAEMIGVLKWWAHKTEIPVHMVNAQQMKTKWKDSFMEDNEYIRKNSKGQTMFMTEFKYKTINDKNIIEPVAWAVPNDDVTHTYDAFRHALDEITYGKGWRTSEK